MSEHFEAAYQAGTPPWDIGRPQPDIEKLFAAGQITGRVLDAGCGTGENSLFLAAQGLSVLGLDAAPTAIAAARAKAKARHLKASFVLANALRLEPSLGPFDTVIDCGLFHVFSDPERPLYTRSLASVLNPGGSLFLLCFSDLQPGDWGPRRLSRKALEACFTSPWHINSLTPTHFATTLAEPLPVAAWLAAIAFDP